MSGRPESWKPAGAIVLVLIVAAGAYLAAAAGGNVGWGEPEGRCPTFPRGIGWAFVGRGPPRPSLRFVGAGKAFRFDTGVLAGTLRSGGRSLGLLPVVDKATNKPVAKSVGLFSHYRLLSADSRYGTAAWGWPSKARLLADGAVQTRWAADAKRPLDMTAVYRWKEPNVLDLTTTVTARKPLRRMEVFLASYFAGFPESLVYARRDGEAKAAFLPAARSAGHWQMFPRDKQAVQTITDGRWKRPPNPVAWKIRPFLAAPLALRRDAKRGLTAVVMAPAEDCFAIATPYGQEGHGSLYLCLLGRDLKAAESATVRSRLVIGRGITDRKAVSLYEAYVREPAGAGTAKE